LGHKGIERRGDISQACAATASATRVHILTDCRDDLTLKLLQVIPSPALTAISKSANDVVTSLTRITDKLILLPLFCVVKWRFLSILSRSFCYCVHINDMIAVMLVRKGFLKTLAILFDISPLCLRQKVLPLLYDTAIGADVRVATRPPVAPAPWALLTKQSVAIRGNKHRETAGEGGRIPGGADTAHIDRSNGDSLWEGVNGE
jgi:hypothetical protein